MRGFELFCRSVMFRIRVKCEFETRSKRKNGAFLTKTRIVIEEANRERDGPIEAMGLGSIHTYDAGVPE